MNLHKIVHNSVLDGQCSLQNYLQIKNKKVVVV